MPRPTWPPRLAFVVGGSEGVGLAAAREFARLGAAVVLFGRSEAKLSAALEGLPGASAHRLDVRDAAETRAVLSETMAHHGTPDLVLLTAGYARAAWWGEQDPAVSTDLVATNLLGALHVTDALVPALRAAGGGRLVLTSSMAGLTGVPGYAAYSASKFGVVGLAQTLRRELHRDGVLVSVLCPPNTATPGLAAENVGKPAEVLRAEEKVKTLSAAAVATALLRALPRAPHTIIPSTDARLSALVARWAPGLLDRILRRR